MRVVKTLASAVCFAFWGVGATFLSWVVLPIVALIMRSRSAEDRMAKGRAITAAANRLFMRIIRFCGLVKFYPKKTELNVPDGAYVLVANHPTLIDVCAITSVLPNICVIAKPKMTRSVFVGRALRAAGHIEAPCKSGSAFSGAAVIAAAVHRLKHGVPVLIFPEGTRSPPASIGKLNRGAFEAARKADVPIACALITADPPTLHRGMRWHELPKEGSSYSIRFLPPISLEDAGGDSKSAATYFHNLFFSHVASIGDRVADASAEVTQQAGVTP